jgi:CRISPR-associated endonuclease Cas1
MRTQATDSLAAWPADLVVPNGVLVLSGYGLQANIWRGRLRFSDGIGRQRRTGIVHRATGGLRRLVILGHSGTLSLEVFQFLADIGAGYVQIDSDSRVIAAFGPGGVDQPTLRRAQALAASSEIGVAITRELLRRKILGQRHSLDILAEHIEASARIYDSLESSIVRLDSVDDIGKLRWIEAEAAMMAWSAWTNLPVRFASQDVGRVPTHWRVFGTRSSAISGQPRAATCPAGAMLNYLYSLLEAESILAARIANLDPGIGISHSDSPHRASFAADLMEPLRPAADQYLIRLLTTRTFGARDFFETRTGVCRVNPTLAKELVETIPDWERLALPLAQEVRSYRRPRKTIAPIAAEKRSPTTTAPRVRTPRPRCGVCGKPVRHRQDRTCSSECETRARIDAGHTGGTKLQGIMQQLRAEGKDPSATPEARAKLGASIARRWAELRSWELENPKRPDPEVYRREVLPIVEGMSLRAMRLATGLSLAQCARIRRGDLVPHPRWWNLLKRLTPLPGDPGPT